MYTLLVVTLVVSSSAVKCLKWPIMCWREALNDVHSATASQQLIGPITYCQLCGIFDELPKTVSFILIAHWHWWNTKIICYRNVLVCRPILLEQHLSAYNTAEHLFGMSEHICDYFWGKLSLFMNSIKVECVSSFTSTGHSRLVCIVFLMYSQIFLYDF